MTLSIAALATGLTAGLASSPHCAAMCGPLAAAACNKRGAIAGPLRYQAGRTLGYMFMGSLAGQLAEVFALRALPAFLLPIGVASVLVWLGVRLWRAQRSPALVQLRTRPPSRPRLLLARILPRDPLPLGMLSALLPCAVLAAALVLAATSGSAQNGAVVMAGFASTSGAGVLGLGYLLRGLARVERRGLARALAIMFMLAAGFVLARPVYSYAAALRSGNTHAQHLSCH